MWKTIFCFSFFLNWSDGFYTSINSSTLPFQLFSRESTPFVPSAQPGTRCFYQVQQFLRALGELQLWALKMQDSSGKLPSGLLNGNVHALGDYWQCLHIAEVLDGTTDEGGGFMTGKYCQVDAYVEAADKATLDPKIESILDLVQSHRAIQSNYFDGVKFFPSFTPITWGFCVPDSCTHEDVRKAVHAALEPHNKTNGLVIRLKSGENHCDLPEKATLYEGVTRPVMIFLWTMTSISLLGTLVEALYPIDESTSFTRSFLYKALGCFSIKRNWETLVNTDPFPDDIPCVHGIRFIFSVTIYLLHRGVFGMFVPFSNRTEIAEALEGEWTMIFRAFWNNVDSFVVLSGLLTSYFSIKKLKSGNKLGIWLMYIRRYYKFTPMYIITVLIVRDVALEIRKGPNAIRVARHFVLTCRNNLWKTIFYIGNLDGMNEMCYPPSHQLITDMQMYMISPIIILLLWKYSRKGMLTVSFMIGSLTLYKGYTIYTGNMGSFIYYGASLTEMLTSANQMYLNPVHRLTPYLFGVMLGYYMQTDGRHFKFTQERLNFGWCTATLAAYYSFFGPKHVANRNYVFNVAESAYFGMVQPILWSFALCWVIFVCNSGRGGLTNKILSWKGFIVFTKLSYAFYLTQILIIFWGIAGSNSPEYMRMHQIVDLNEIVVILFMSVMFTLLFLLPLGELHNLIPRNITRQKEPHKMQAVSLQDDLHELASSNIFSAAIS